MNAPVDPFASSRAFRDTLVASTIRQLFGPRPDDPAEEQDELLTISPLQLYATGVLFPQKMIQQVLEDSRDAPTEDETETLEGLPKDLPVVEARGARQDGDGSDDREPLNLANEFSPSAAGISFAIGQAVSLVVRATWATYSAESIEEAHPFAGQTRLDGRLHPATRRVQAWRRNPGAREIVLPSATTLGAQPPIPLDAEAMLTLRTTVRSRGDGRLVYSCMLVNERRAQGIAAPSCGDVYFQVGLKIVHGDGEAVFLPIDRSVGEAVDDPELASMDLLFRHRRAFALGHGTAGDWNRDEALSESGAVDWVAAVAVPDYELKPILPRTTPFDEARTLKLSMGFLYDAGGDDPRAAIPAVLRDLARDYESWIIEQEATIGDLDSQLLEAARKNLANCRACLARMLCGIALLEREADALRAFRLMNKAMFVQQHHSRLPRRGREDSLPHGPGDGRDKSWRPFQLGFILMNLASAFDPLDQERKIVDLIWFPTGGGKTEAYLGLSAFTIILNRLRGKASGCTVLMRYTLRLLTAQQFQRASALTLAIEMLRRNRDLGSDLGDEPITIGLWVGRSLSPNTRDDHVKYRLGDDPFLPRDNILAGAAYLREMLDRFGRRGFLAAYNAGPARYQQHLATGRPLPAETIDYVRKLMPFIDGLAPVSLGSRKSANQSEARRSSIFVQSGRDRNADRQQFGRMMDIPSEPVSPVTDTPNAPSSRSATVIDLTAIEPLLDRPSDDAGITADSGRDGLFPPR